MTPSLIALKLTLDALELPSYNSCFPLCSNGLYLSQTYVHDLGYHYHYQNGHPTSDRLLHDFVHLTDALESGDREHYQQQLTPPNPDISQRAPYLSRTRTDYFTHTRGLDCPSRRPRLSHTHESPSTLNPEDNMEESVPN